MKASTQEEFCHINAKQEITKPGKAQHRNGGGRAKRRIAAQFTRICRQENSAVKYCNSIGKDWETRRRP